MFFNAPGLLSQRCLLVDTTWTKEPYTVREVTRFLTMSFLTDVEWQNNSPFAKQKQIAAAQHSFALSVKTSQRYEP